MAERSNAAVLKTVEVKASGGSNPSLSASKVSKLTKPLQIVDFAGVFVWHYVKSFIQNQNFGE
jgi:hypothetical protein